MFVYLGVLQPSGTKTAFPNLLWKWSERLRLVWRCLAKLSWPLTSKAASPNCPLSLLELVSKVEIFPIITLSWLNRSAMVRTIPALEPALVWRWKLEPPVSSSLRSNKTLAEIQPPFKSALVILFFWADQYTPVCWPTGTDAHRLKFAYAELHLPF